MQVELAQLRYRLPRLRGRGIAAEPAGRRHRHPRSRRDAARGRPPAHPAPDHEARARPRRSSARTRATQRKARRRRALPHGRARRLHERGQVDAAQPAHRTPGVLVEDQLFSTLDPTTRRLHLPGGETVLLLRHGRLRAPPAAPARRGVPLDARGGRRRRSARCTSSTRAAPDAEAPDRRGATRCSREIDAGDVPVLLVVEQGRPRRPRARRRAARARIPDSVAVSARDRRRGRRAARRDRRPAARARPASSSCVVPYDRGDVLAALHRDGEVLVEVHDDDGTRVRARLPDASRLVTRLGPARPPTPAGRASPVVAPAQAD